MVCDYSSTLAPGTRLEAPGLKYRSKLLKSQTVKGRKAADKPALIEAHSVARAHRWSGVSASSACTVGKSGNQLFMSIGLNCRNHVVSAKISTGSLGASAA